MEKPLHSEKGRKKINETKLDFHKTFYFRDLETIRSCSFRLFSTLFWLNEEPRFASFSMFSLLLISFDISQLAELSWKTISKPLTGLILKKISRKMEILFTADTFLVNTFLQSRWCPLYGVLTVILTKAECKITEWIIKV